MVNHLKSESDFNEIVKGEKPVLVDFYATWCGPCKMIAPIIDEIAEEQNDVEICKLNVDEAYDVVKKCNVVGIPALVLFKDGKEVARKLGYCKKQEILDMFK